MMCEPPSVKAAAFVAALAIGGSLSVSAQDAGSLNPMTAVDKAALSGFLDRPLFDPSRRRPPDTPALPVTAVAASVEPPPTLHLLGVVQGDRDMAIVQRDGQAKTFILRTGDHIGDWILTVVPPVGVRLDSGKRSFEYALFGKAKGRAEPVDVSLPSVGLVTAGVVDPASTPTGPVDSIGMPEVAPSSWGISSD